MGGVRANTCNDMGLERQVPGRYLAERPLSLLLRCLDVIKSPNSPLAPYANFYSPTHLHARLSYPPPSHHARTVGHLQ